VDLRTEVPDVDLDDVRIAVEREIPHAREDLRLRDDLSRVAQQELEHRELASREVDRGAAARDGLARRVEHEVAGGQGGRSRRGTAADERTQAREQPRE